MLGEGNIFFMLPMNLKCRYGLVIYSMIAVFISSVTKYALYMRKNKLNVKYGYLQKLLLLKDKKITYGYVSISLSLLS